MSSQDMKDKISVIIPVYNAEALITETVQAIQRSSYSNLEILLINDGSTDNSAAIIEDLAQEDKRIFLYTKGNGGVVSARNYGIEKVTGDFICFCDQDDLVMEDMYQKLYEKIQNDRSDMGMCTTGRSIDGRKSPYDIMEDGVYTGEEINKILILPMLFNGFCVPFEVENVNRYPHIWRCMFRTEFWRKNNFRFRAYVNHEDDLLLKLEALCKADRVSTISYVGYYWRVNFKSETYAHKYVENIGDKQQQMLQDMKCSLTYKIQDDKILRTFERVTLCKQYLDAIHNLASPYKKKSISFIRDYYKSNIYGRNFTEAIESRKMIRRGRVKPKVLLPILAHRFTLCSFVLEIILDRMLLITLHSQALTKLERRIKLRGLGQYQ